MANQVDGKAYYGYLFGPDKRPNKTLTALLRGIGKYIISSIGDKDVHSLTPAKLAAFFKAVGGNYDSLFVEIPHPSISYIYQSLGCQHTLQPTSNDFTAPSVPALTLRGYVRWQSIEILLGPDEHVSYLQSAVRNFGIKHPDTGEPFPVDLPRAAFPLIPDPLIIKWHSSCAEKLSPDSVPAGDNDLPGSRPTLPPRPKIPPGYSHLRSPYSPGRSPRERKGGADYFNSRPVSHHHSPFHKAYGRREPSQRSHLTPDIDERGRRRSVPENYHSPSHQSPVPPPPQPLNPEFPRNHSRRVSEEHTRRHSHPRHRQSPSSSSSLSEESDTESAASEVSASPDANTTRPRQSSKEPTSVRFAVPVPPSPSPASPATGSSTPLGRHHRNRGASVPNFRQDPRLASYNISIDSTGKLSAPFMQAAPPHARSNSQSIRWQDLLNIPTHKLRTPAQEQAQDSITDGDGLRERRRGERPRLVTVRSGSHDGRMRDYTREARGTEDEDSEGRRKVYSGGWRGGDGRRREVRD